MRSTRRRTWALLAAPVAFLAFLAPIGLRAVVTDGGQTGPAESVPDPSGSECRTSVEGSRVVAYCHNPYPSTDRVQLHTECGRWWDVDADSSPVDVGPGRTVRLDDRCWKEVASSWITHERVQDAV